MPEKVSFRSTSRIAKCNYRAIKVIRGGVAGFRILAGFHTGAINSSPCRNCNHDKQLARIRGCDGRPADRPAEWEYWEGVKILYWNCPTHFIPDSISEWYTYYKYHKDFPGAKMPDIQDKSPKFLQAYTYYERCLNEYRSILSKRGS